MSRTEETGSLAYLFQIKKESSDIFHQKNIYDFINIQKERRQDEEIRLLQKQYSEIHQQFGNFNQRLTDLESNNFFDCELVYPENEVSEEDMFQKQSVVLTNDILGNVKELYQTEDIQEQISCCVSIAEKTFQLLKAVEKTEENNYKKDMIHLFYQVIKRNYARGKFNDAQIGLMMEMLEKSQKFFVDEEEYFELDERLYLNNLEIFPVEE